MRPCLRCKNPGCAARGSSELNYEGSAITCYGFEPITKGDKIRAGTDEELAEVLMATEKYGRIHNGGRTLEWWLEWLRQEAEDG